MIGSMSSKHSRGVCGIFWDLQNSPVIGSPAVAIAKLKQELSKYGQLQSCRAYADLSRITAKTREDLHGLGIALTDVPGHRKEAADKAMIVDMFTFALDNKAPATIVLISGDGDFSVSLSRLGDRGYHVVVIYPSKAQLSTVLQSAANESFAWNELQALFTVPGSEVTGIDTLRSASPVVTVNLVENKKEEGQDMTISTSKEENSMKALCKQVASKLTDSKIYIQIIEVLSQAGPDGMTASRVMKSIKGLGPALSAETGGIRISLAMFLIELPKISSKLLENGQISFYVSKIMKAKDDEANDAEKIQFIDAVYIWLLEKHDSIEILASRIVRFYAYCGQEKLYDDILVNRWKSCKLRQVIDAFGKDKLDFSTDGTSGYIRAKIPLKKMLIVKNLILHNQLLAGDGVRISRYPQFHDRYLKNPFFKKVSAEKIITTFGSFSPQLFMLTSNKIYTANFNEQQLSFKAALPDIIKSISPTEGISPQKLQTLLDKICADHTITSDISPMGTFGLISALVKRNILWSKQKGPLSSSSSSSSSNFYLVNKTITPKPHSPLREENKTSHKPSAVIASSAATSNGKSLLNSIDSFTTSTDFNTELYHSFSEQHIAFLDTFSIDECADPPETISDQNNYLNDLNTAPLCLWGGNQVIQQGASPSSPEENQSSSARLASSHQEHQSFFSSSSSFNTTSSIHQNDNSI